MKKILAAIMAMIMGIGVLNMPVMAAEQSEKPATQAAILTKCASKNPEGGNGVICIVSLVVDIMSVGIGILGVIGISVVGIQYLTAGGSEEKVRKSKRRMFEIVIGLVAYALMYAILKFLNVLPS